MRRIALEPTVGRRVVVLPLDASIGPRAGQSASAYPFYSTDRYTLLQNQDEQVIIKYKLKSYVLFNASTKAVIKRAIRSNETIPCARKISGNIFTC